MAEIEEMNIEQGKIEEVKAENRVWLTKVTFSNGDYITVSGNDISIIERFLSAGEELEALANEMEKSNADADEKDYKKAIEDRKHFSEKAAQIMDDVFGEGTTRKFFGDVYEVIPDFQPDLECFMDFWDSLIPVIERLSEHKIKLEKLASKQRMAKYVPQDHKKKAGRQKVDSAHACAAHDRTKDSESQ